MLELRPYQRRWLEDRSRAKIFVKSARIGVSFSSAAEVVLDCLEHPGTTWTVLSASDPQAVEWVGICQQHLEAIRQTGELFNEPFVDELGESTVTQHRIQFANGSRIIALACNPRTARGYPGNAVLNEFAHVENSYAIWAAITRQIALGHRLLIESTPNGKQGKFFELAADMGLADGVAPTPNPVRKGNWSGHYCDVHLARKEGCPIDPEEQRDLMKDANAFAQEFLCQFQEPAGAWLPLELIAQCEHGDATLDWPAGYQPTGPLYAGLDVARDRDMTILWLDELVGDVLWTRMVLGLHGMPLNQQHDLLAPWIRMTTRTAMDATGMGVGLYDYLNKSCPGRVMGVNFAGTNDQGVKIKVDLAVRLKDRMEKSLDRLPRSAEVRQDLMAIKREPTASGVKFDAPRIEVETPFGAKRKVYSHADRFWAKALADFAANQAGISVELMSGGFKTAASDMGRGWVGGYGSSAAVAARGY